jgi:hypothetical protein
MDQITGETPACMHTVWIATTAAALGEVETTAAATEGSCKKQLQQHEVQQYQL